MRRHLALAAVALLLAAAPALAQTAIITDTTKVGWTPSTDNATTFGTPPQPVLTSYRAEFYLKANVTNGVPNAGATAAITLDWGKPTPDATNTQTGPVVKPLIQANTEYYVFIRSVGPGGVSAQSPGLGPFGFPSAPAPVLIPRLVN